MALKDIILVLKLISGSILTGVFSTLGIESVFQVLLSSSSNLLCMNHFPDALIIVYTFPEQMQRGRNTSLHLELSLSVQSSTPHVATNTADAGRLQNLAQQMSHQETLRALASYGSECWLSVLKSSFKNKILMFLFHALQYKSCF